jgi:hypothetical protein
MTSYLLLRALTLVSLFLRVHGQSSTNDTTFPTWGVLPANGTVPGTTEAITYQWTAFVGTNANGLLQNEYYFLEHALLNSCDFVLYPCTMSRSS